MKTWTYADEIVLLRAVARFKPLGAEKLANLNEIVKAVNAVLTATVTKKDVTEKLATLYDLEALEELGSASSEEKLSSIDIDKSDDDQDDDSNSEDEDDKQEAKRTVLTRSSTRRQTPESDSAELKLPSADHIADEKTAKTKVRKSSRIRASSPAKEASADELKPQGTPTSAKTTETTETEDVTVLGTAPKEDKLSSAESSASPESETGAGSDEELEQEPEPEPERQKSTRKRTRSFALQTPALKALKLSSAATPSTRRSTRINAPAVVEESTPSKPNTRNSVRKSLKPVPLTPGTSSALANTPSASNRRRSMRKK